MPLALCSATNIDVKVKIQDATPLATPVFLRGTAAVQPTRSNDFFFTILRQGQHFRARDYHGCGRLSFPQALHAAITIQEAK